MPRDPDEPLLNLTSGPVDAYPGVSRAMSKPLALPGGPVFRAFFRETIAKLRRAMMTQMQPIILQGEVVLGLEAAAASLIGRHDTVLNLATGPYGRGFAAWAARHAKDVITHEVATDAVIAPDAVERWFRERPDISVVSVVHLETSCGSINPVAEIGAIAHRHGACVIVDAASSWAGMPITPERVHADVFVTGPHKCLGGVPGLALLAVSVTAWERMESNPDAPRKSYLSILDWKNAADADGHFPFMPSIADLYGLDAALDLFLDEGAEAVWARHRRASGMLRAGLPSLGLGIWPRDASHAADTLTSVRLPDGVAAPNVLARARRDFGVTFSPGRGDLAERAIVVGLMGRTAHPLFALTALVTLASVLRALGRTPSLDAAVEAALAAAG